MRSVTVSTTASAALAAIFLALSAPALADGNLNNVQHIVVLMQENHSFDNYFGVLPYATGSPYHNGPCAANDHSCVDGLKCTRDLSGNYTCTNSNTDPNSSPVTSFHSSDYCVKTDLDHSWYGVHVEGNSMHPNSGLKSSPQNGFVIQNDSTNQPDNGNENSSDDETMSFYNETDIPYYYTLAQTFGVDDRYFSSVLGPTFPNRSYLMAATSFGHLDTNEEVPPLIIAVYQPITGTIFDLLDNNGVTWTDYSDDVPQGSSFREFLLDAAHFRSFDGKGLLGGVPNSFIQDAANGTLPSVAFVDPNFGILSPENDEHPGSDIRLGETFISQALAAVRNSPEWSSTVVFLTYDEHGGFYDHTASPRALQGGARNPDGINPGQCEDASNPPSSEQPGGGSNCLFSFFDALKLCPSFTTSGPYPSSCANFNQYGMRVPLTAISPFAKPHYVSHTIADHTALLALIEKRFLSRTHLTSRDGSANTLEDMFDFNNAPSLNAQLPPTPPPASSSDPGCS